MCPCRNPHNPGLPTEDPGSPSDAASEAVSLALYGLRYITTLSERNG